MILKTMEVPETRYVDSGGLKIAYQVIGDGAVDLAVVPGFVSNLDMQWTDPEWTRFNAQLASFSRVVMHDKAGTGLSDPVAAVPTLEQRMEDLHAVLDAAGVERPILLGISEGGPMSLLFAATYPERVRGLILYGSLVCGLLSDDNPAGPRWLDWMSRMRTVVDNWGKGLLVDVMSPTLAGQPLVRRLCGVHERAMASPAMARAAYDAFTEIDARDVLSAIRTPTLVVHRVGDAIPIEGARYITEQVPGARLLELPGADHWWWVGDSNSILDAIEEFVTGTRPERPVDRMLATVLFTDIVGSTTRAVELGDNAWRELLARHNDRTREQLAAFRGTEVTCTGDGFLAIFDGPARGVRCARAITESVHDLGIEVRAGLHAGECEVLNDNIGGIAVHIGAHVAAAAGSGEVLVTSTVHDLVAGSGIAFEDAGDHELKGVPGPWRLYRAVEIPLAYSGTREPAPLGVQALVHEPPPLSQRAIIAAVRRSPRLIRRLSAGLVYRRVAQRRRGQAEATTQRSR
jgi:class 3 adenylate cyclase/pimeloyl-ACP methyl ester carboxylesterase